MKRVEIVVIGGGPAGSAAASGLAALGREVVLIERAHRPHHKVCGEFLSIETQGQLHRLGINPTGLGAVEIERVVVRSKIRDVAASLPFRALSLSRYRLDQALLDRARDRGVRLKQGVTARGVIPDDREWTVVCDDEETLRCRHLVVATGKLGLRGIEDKRDGSQVGLKIHLRPTAEIRRVLAGQVELFLMDRSYAGLELVEDKICNLCCLLPRTVVMRLGADWTGLQGYLSSMVPSLAERLAGAAPLFPKPIAVVCPKGGHLHTDAESGIFRVGDRLAHIPPFTGDGLAIALTSAALAVEHIRRGCPSDVYLAEARKLIGSAVRVARAVSGLAANRIGRAALLGGATCAPALIGAIARRTRLPLAAGWS
ncbi:MAG TPA: FAD-dependent oxidoreductase [Pseudolabrys sp.]